MLFSDVDSCVIKFANDASCMRSFQAQAAVPLLDLTTLSWVSNHGSCPSSLLNRGNNARFDDSVFGRASVLASFLDEILESTR